MAKKRRQLPQLNRGYFTTNQPKCVVSEVKSNIEEERCEVEEPVEVGAKVVGDGNPSSPDNEVTLPNVTNLQTNQIKRARRFQNLANKRIDSLQTHITRLFQDSSFFNLPNLNLDSQNPKLYDELVSWAQNKPCSFSLV